MGKEYTKVKDLVSKGKKYLSKGLISGLTALTLGAGVNAAETSYRTLDDLKKTDIQAMRTYQTSEMTESDYLRCFCFDCFQGCFNCFNCFFSEI